MSGPISPRFTACARIFKSIAALPTSPFNAEVTCLLIANSNLDAFLVSPLLIPDEAAPQFLDGCAPCNGMMPPPDSQMISPPHNGMIPPRSGLAGAAVGLIRSPLWQSKGAIDASGADGHARCARDSSAESFVDIDA
jgi:hypothetical protein